MTRPVVHAYRDPARDWPPTAPRLRYAIVTSPRTGSTWLAEALAQTGEAGVPMEYLHPALIQRAAAQDGFRPDSYLAELENRRTTPNGRFGLKILAGQTFGKFAEAERERLARYLLGRLDRAILLERRDKLAQAVSFYVAQETQTFQLAEAGAQAALRRQASDLALPPEAVAQALHSMVAEHQLARRLLAAYGPTPLYVAYEDLLADPVGQFRRVFAQLGVQADPAGLAPASYRARDAELEARTEALRAWFNGHGPHPSAGGAP